MPNQRKTIAVLIDHFDHSGHGYESRLRRGFTRACTRFDLDLLLVAAGEPRAPSDRGTRHSGVHDLVHADAVDGVIVISSRVFGSRSADELARVCRRYAPLPLCSVGLAVPGVPSVVLDNRPALRALLEHLIVEHRRHELALIGGPEEDIDAALQVEVYREVLADHALQFDARLVRRAALTSQGGRQAMEALVSAGAAFDALVAANDAIALGAAELLRSHGRAGGVSVVSFDELALAGLVAPPLTTARQPLEELATVAVERIVDQLQGRSVPAVTSLSATLRVRESCGCAPVQTRARRPHEADSAVALLARESERLASLVDGATHLPDQGGISPGRALVDALAEEVGESHGAFLEQLERIAGSIEDQAQYGELQVALTVLRDELRAASEPDLDDMWDAARRSVARASTRAEVRLSIDATAMYRKLSNARERLSDALELDEFRSRVTRELLGIGVTDAVVAVHVEGAPERLTCLSCVRDGKVYDPAEAEYSASRIFPPGAWSHEGRRTSCLLPLSAGGENIGVALFELDRSPHVHELLCEHISDAMHIARLRRQILQQAAAHDRASQERRAAAQRMQSLRVLAGGVAHDLNNALGPLLALPSVIAQELADDARALPLDRGRLRTDLMTIQSAALRASQTIKDLLTLGRQGQTERLAIDLNQAMRAWQASAEVPEGHSVVLDVDLERQPLVVKASEAHLLRAIANLVRNAMEAAEPAGSVRVETRRVHLSEPYRGHELIPAGRYAVLLVSDTGQGISKDVLARLFEPFVTTKRLSRSSGSGLGLAVVHGVMKEHAGFVDVRTEAGRGTTFSLYFPLTSEVPRRVAPVSTPPRGNGRLLVVDDDPVQLTTTRRVLAHLGYEVTTLSSGREAYEVLAAARHSEPTCLGGVYQSPFDIIVADMMLNEAADGIELIERILELFPEQRALITSGNAPDERARVAIERGLGWLTKPYTVNALAKAVKQLLGVDPHEPLAETLAPAHSFTAMLRPAPVPGKKAMGRGSGSGKRR